MYNKSDSIFMNIAIDYAWRFQILTLPNPAVASLILWNNKIIALQAHKKSGTPHAEVLACKEAFLYFLNHDKKSKESIYNTLKKQNNNSNFIRNIKNYIQELSDSKEIHDFIQKYHSNIFNDCEIFITLEPCNHYGKTPPCANLLNIIKPKRIIIAHKDTHIKAKGGSKTLKNIKIKHRILEYKSKDLLFPFMQWQKNNGFTIFKIAHRLNGDYKGGFISNKDSRIFTHNMRCIADYIIISGETLRNDNPLLDTRFALPFYKQKNIKQGPKIIIISKTIKNKDIINYNIKDRDIEIIDCISKIPQNGLKIIEGGFEFLNSLLKNTIILKKNKKKYIEIDCIMGYISTSIKNKYLYNNSNIIELEDFYLAHNTELYDFWIQQSNENIKNISKKPINTKNILYFLFHKN